MLFSINKIKNKGFTLIELLAVIAIIGLLSSVVMASLNSARAKARDSLRISQMIELQKAIESYIASNGNPPVCNISKNNSNVWCGGENSSVSNPLFIAALQPLVDGGFISRIPTDPTEGINHMNYEYYTLPDNNPELDADKWWCGDINNKLQNYNYVLRFSTETTKFSGLSKFMWDRVSGEEYCILGQKVR